MNLEEARVILGLSEEEMSDTELMEHIEVAALLKDIFFDMLKNKVIPLK